MHKQKRSTSASKKKKAKRVTSGSRATDKENSEVNVMNSLAFTNLKLSLKKINESDNYAHRAFVVTLGFGK